MHGDQAMATADDPLHRETAGVVGRSALGLARHRRLVAREVLEPQAHACEAAPLDVENATANRERLRHGRSRLIGRRIAPHHEGRRRVPQLGQGRPQGLVPALRQRDAEPRDLRQPLERELPETRRLHFPLLAVGAVQRDREALAQAVGQLRADAHALERYARVVDHAPAQRSRRRGDTTSSPSVPSARA